MEKKKTALFFCFTLAVLILDQLIKIAVKTHLYYGESIRITNWFYITFIENNGMAFGMQIMPKAIQTIMRLVFSGFIVWYMIRLIKSKYKNGYIACISLILAGALGNVLDSIFYGVIFSRSSYTDIATFVPIGEGYAEWLYGKVVDMFYFPLFEFDWPQFLPLIGGDHFLFFAPVFNLADAAISCGTIAFLIFYSKSFTQSFSLLKETKKQTT